jgi:cbb3-type cytochrome oxidase subunit 3
MAMVVPVATFVFVILIIWIVFSARHKREKLQAELCLKALETGQPLPEGLFQRPTARKIKPLKVSIILISVAVGVSLWALIDGELDMAAMALVPFFIGVGYLVIYFLSKKRGDDEAK